MKSKQNKRQHTIMKSSTTKNDCFVWIFFKLKEKYEHTNMHTHPVYFLLNETQKKMEIKIKI